MLHNSAAMFLSAILLGGLGLYLRSLIDWKARARGFSLPPGPQGLPIIGNWFDMPARKPWLGFREMRKTYGDMICLRVLRQRILVVGSAQVALELLKKRSANTSDRPVNEAFELSGQDFNIVFMPYSQRWRQHRRAFWQQFHPGVIAKYQQMQRAETHKFLAKLLESPSRLTHHIKGLFSATMLKLVYDINVASDEDEHISMLDDAMEAVSLANHGGFLVERLPFLRHVPAWVPGAGFQKILARTKAANQRLKHEPLARLKDSLRRGETHPCIAAGMLARINKETEPDAAVEEEDIIKNTCTITFEAASDTSFSMLQAVFVALALHPDAQMKAQNELDTVVGPHRMPDYSDSDALIYLNALLKEALRWHNVVPLCIPHRTLSDDTIRGYFIPAGTVILPNIWEILHDPEAYEAPQEFRPERFIRDGKLDPSVRDPDAFVFGFGRRICPGRHFAHASLFIAVASVLHVFDIRPPLDEHGKPITINFEQSHGLISYPEDCRCSIGIRSAEAASLVLEAQRRLTAVTSAGGLGGLSKDTI